MSRRKGISPVIWGFIGFGLAFVIVCATLVILKQREENIAVAQAAKVYGPPCPTLTAEAFAAKGYRIRHRFMYAESAFGRDTGHVNCQDLADKDGAGLSGVVHLCQFTSASVIEVKNGADLLHFEPPIGSPSTVAVEGDKVSCLLGGNFRLN